MDELSEPAELRCPTCGAAQPPAAECRRCKCDLRLYVEVLRQGQRWRKIALRALRARSYLAAADAARRYRTASPSQDAARLSAVAHLLAGRYAAALAAYHNPEAMAEH